MADLSDINSLEDVILRMANPVKHLTKKSKNFKDKGNEIDKLILNNLLNNESEDTYKEISSLMPDMSSSIYHGNPKMAFLTNMVQSLVKAKLLYDVGKERKENRKKVLSYLGIKDLERKEEKDRLNEIAKETMKNIQEEQEFKRQEKKANLKKVYAEIQNLNDKPIRENLKEKKEEEKERRQLQVKQAESFKKSLSPETYSKILDKATKGEFDPSQMSKKGGIDDIPILNKFFGHKDKYNIEAHKKLHKFLDPKTGKVSYEYV
jgi:hypothetical protein